VGAGGEMNQALYAHMNNKRKMKKKKRNVLSKIKIQSYLDPVLPGFSFSLLCQG
jgi:hypothetical protein